MEKTITLLLPLLIGGTSEERVKASEARRKFAIKSRGIAPELRTIYNVKSWLYFDRFGIFQKDVN